MYLSCPGFIYNITLKSVKLHQRRRLEKTSRFSRFLQHSYDFHFEKLQHMQAVEQHMTFGRGGGVHVKMCLLLSWRKDAQIWEH